VEGHQLAVLITSQALLLLTLAGLWKRRRLTRLWLLPVYLVATILAQALAFARPDVFKVWRVWALRELAWFTLSLTIVAEVAWRAFVNLPEQRRQARILLFVSLLIPFGMVALTPWNQGHLGSATWLYVVVVEILPRLTYGAGFVCLALVWAMAKHLIPRDPLHASVVLGLAAYLFIYSVSLGLQTQGGAPALVYTVTPASYTLMLVLWAWVAWRHEPIPDAPEHVRHLLQPWRF
jgi:hypothetical protein